MKILILLSVLFLSGMTQAAHHKDFPIAPQILEALRQNVCNDVVGYAKSKGLKKYKMRHCLKNLEVSYVKEKYNVNPHSRAEFEIYFEDDYAKELIETDQWLMCEASMTEPLNPDDYEFIYCSIEG